MSESKVKPLYWIGDEVMLPAKIISIRVNSMGDIRYELMVKNGMNPYSLDVLEKNIIGKSTEYEEVRK